MNRPYRFDEPHVILSTYLALCALLLVDDHDQVVKAAAKTTPSSTPPSDPKDTREGTEIRRSPPLRLQLAASEWPL